MEMVTAIANDIAFEDIFVCQLRTLAEPDDVFLSVSSSGDSENIVGAVDWAAENGVYIIVMTGFDGGRSTKRAKINLHVAADNYGAIEDVHLYLIHILAQFLRKDAMTVSRIGDNRF
jgi:phosphoheptose isomerase